MFDGRKHSGWARHSPQSDRRPEVRPLGIGAIRPAATHPEAHTKALTARPRQERRDAGERIIAAQLSAFIVGIHHHADSCFPQPADRPHRPSSGIRALCQCDWRPGAVADVTSRSAGPPWLSPSPDPHSCTSWHCRRSAHSRQSPCSKDLCRQWPPVPSVPGALPDR